MAALKNKRENIASNIKNLVDLDQDNIEDLDAFPAHLVRKAESIFKDDAINAKSLLLLLVKKFVMEKKVIINDLDQKLREKLNTYKECINILFINIYNKEMTEAYWTKYKSLLETEVMLLRSTYNVKALLDTERKEAKKKKYLELKEKQLEKKELTVQEYNNLLKGKGSGPTAPSKSSQSSKKNQKKKTPKQKKKQKEKEAKSTAQNGQPKPEKKRKRKDASNSNKTSRRKS
jgi:hypothetical protein